jgi:hypothetical protein
MVVFLHNTNLFATHLSGGEFKYEQVGQDSFLIEFNLFRHCSGISAPNQVNIQITNTCGFPTSSVTLQNSNPGGTYFTQVCPSAVNQSTCFGGWAYSGIQMMTYSGLVVLPNACSEYEVSWSSCCRNNVINISNGLAQNMYISAKFNTAFGSSFNSSPVFESHPEPYYTDATNYGSLRSYDPDGDSLVFSFVDPLVAQNTPINWNPGYSTSAPIPGITLNPATGEFTGTVPFTGAYLMAIQVCEYDRVTGILKGCVTRDDQLAMVSSSEQSPDIVPGIHNLSGAAVQTGANYIEASVGSQFSFEVHFIPNDTLDSIAVESNILTALGGNGTVTFSGVNPVVATVNITVTPDLVGMRYLTLWGVNYACPVYFFSDVVIQFDFHASVTPPVTVVQAGLDQQICPGSSGVQLGGNTTAMAQWSVLSGDPISIGTNFSCNPCANPVASPTQTTTYLVYDSNFQVAYDTVEVVVLNANPIQRNFVPETCMQNGDLALIYTPSLFDSNMTFSTSPIGGSGPISIYQNGMDGMIDVQTSGSGYWNLDLTYTYNNGCVSTHSDIIHVRPMTPQADFTYAVNGSSVQFSNTTVGPYNYINWDFGDGNSSIDPNPQHSYQTIGTYFAMLTIGDSCGTTFLLDTIDISIILDVLPPLDFGTVAVFPNPASEFFRLTISEDYAGGEAIIRDAKGMVLRRINGLLPSQVIDISEMANGLYFVELKSGDSRVLKRLIIQH